MVKWIITKYQHSWVDSRLLVQLWTDERIHAFLHYSLSPEIFSYTGGIRRGVRRLVTPLWELPNQITIEQAQNGDTLSHAFYIAAVPNLATLTFYISATHNGVEAKSVAIPIKVVHPMQGGADEVDCPDLEETLRFIPWASNHKDAVGCDLNIWYKTGMTGTASVSHNWDDLRLSIGATPGSIAEIWTSVIFDLAFDHTLESQLRAVVSFPIITNNSLAYIIHGSIDSDSCYGFTLYQGDICSHWRRSDRIEGYQLIPDIEAGRPYLLEAKFRPGHSIEFWVDSEWQATVDEYLPDTAGHGFHARITDPDTANIAVQFRRFMLWKQSIWTGECYSP